MPTTTRLIRNAVILAKIEGTTGTDATPGNTTDAMLFGDLSITPVDAQLVDRNLMRAWLGASEQLIGPQSVRLGFSCEFVGAGTVATAPPWAPLVRGCGLAQTLTATVRADYTPVSTGFETLTIYYYDDGVLHKLLAAQGTFTGAIEPGSIPKLNFAFTGLDGAVSAASNPVPTLTAWKQPQAVRAANSGDLTLGATHSTTLAPAFSGGTAYPSMGIKFDVGNVVNFKPMLTRERVDITDRKTRGSIEIEATAAEEVALISAVKAGTLTSIGLLHGTVANNKTGIWLPACQLINPGKGDRNGVRTMTLDFIATPSSGNDEIRLIASF